ncbi:hypothetical protein TRAPUB_9661 [Trametes pubescens]|uniref:Uncharacterized protein n=1 Tax=Trametes pubescens TaxID=154538 RepID=A0A1M2W1T3_TRAPU|nr:hypothetical protein TRAPUB_9661 [Trametes pubescens]
MSTVPALAQRSASVPQPYTPVPSSSTAPALCTRGRIHVDIPSKQAANARATTPAITPIHGYPLNSAVSSPRALFSVLDTPVTPTHGHGDFVVPSSYHSAPTTPTQRRVSARTRRSSSLLSASRSMDDNADAPSPAARGIMKPHMEEEDEEHEHEGLHNDEDEDKHENSSAGSSVDESHTDAPVLTAA